MARAISTFSSSELGRTRIRFEICTRFGERYVPKDGVKHGFTSEIPQMVVLTPYPRNEGLGRLNPLV